MEYVPIATRGHNTALTLNIDRQLEHRRSQQIYPPIELERKAPTKLVVTDAQIAAITPGASCINIDKHSTAAAPSNSTDDATTHVKS
jgi:hypothetical protein